MGSVKLLLNILSERGLFVILNGTFRKNLKSSADELNISKFIQGDVIALSK